MNGIRYVVYGVFVKTLVVTYMLNILDIGNHAVGYRNYETGDLSKNSRLMGVLFGSVVAWHNNHHAHPGLFSVKRNWWEWDGHYLMMKAFEQLGLVAGVTMLDDRDAHRVVQSETVR